jgi:hypothetical protein
MGYQTKFSISIEPMDKSLVASPSNKPLLFEEYTNPAIYIPNQISEAIAKEMGVDDIRTYDDLQDMFDNDSMKWYSYKKDVVKVSAKFPGWLITISGEGEQTEDVWNTYFLDGKYQHAQAVFSIEPFDESRLVSLNRI